MGIMVCSLSCVMQDLYHQQYLVFFSHSAVSVLQAAEALECTDPFEGFTGGGGGA